jgi:hypothetical protein
LTRDTFWGHVVRCTNEGVGVTLGAEFTTDTEIAQFNLAVAAQKNVGRLDVCRSLAIEVKYIEKARAYLDG